MIKYKNFDVFISYQSKDETRAQIIRKALQQRGVQVWLDKDQIRPGDQFVTALENGLETSRAVALLTTSSSIKSGWVQEEYHRALALCKTGDLQLIPLLLDDTKLPGFLSSRQNIDLKDFANLEKAIDRLVWPGITGKKVTWFPIFGRYNSTRWKQLFLAAEAEGINFSIGEDLDRSIWFINSLLNESNQRIVIVFDLFEERPAINSNPRNSIMEYLNVLLEFRKSTKGTSKEIIFVLYQQSSAWKDVPEVQQIDISLVKRFQHYFTIHQDLGEKQLQNELRSVWNKVQRDLMIAERTGRAF